MKIGYDHPVQSVGCGALLQMVARVALSSALVVLAVLAHPERVGSLRPSEAPAYAAELQRSILHGADKEALALLAAGAPLMAKKGGQTALMLAAYKGNVVLTKALLAESGTPEAGPNASTLFEACTALPCAVATPPPARACAYYTTPHACLRTKHFVRSFHLSIQQPVLLCCCAVVLLCCCKEECLRA